MNNIHALNRLEFCVNRFFIILVFVVWIKRICVNLGLLSKENEVFFTIQGHGTKMDIFLSTPLCLVFRPFHFTLPRHRID